MMVALTYAEVAMLDPHPLRLKRAVELLGGEWTVPIDADTARHAGVPLYDIICVASRLAQRNQDVARRMRLWAADCAAHMLPIYESRHPADQRPRNAIIAARYSARGDNAFNAAYAAAADTAAYAAYAAADTAAGTAAAAECAWQFERLCAYLSEHEPDDWPLMDREAA